MEEEKKNTGEGPKGEIERHTPAPAGLDAEKENIPENLLPGDENRLPVTEAAAPGLPQNADYKQETENMEVHHHTHPSHGKKSWKEYFWEFLMLFLAVFCGFLAEYQLEHLIEHQREKAYIKSFVEDVKKDTDQLKMLLTVMDSKLLYRDSLLAELGNPAILSNSNRAYYFMQKSYHFPDFIYNDRTIQQLKNSGGMRLLRNKEVSDRIMDYDAKVRTLFIHQQQMNVIALNFVGSINRLFQKRLMETGNRETLHQPVPLLTSDKKNVEEFYNNMSDQKNGFILLKTVETDLLMTGVGLIEFIKKEYPQD